MKKDIFKPIFKPVFKPVFKTDSEISKEAIMKDPAKYGLTIAEAKYLNK